MRRIGDLMKDLGFNKDAPEETAKAFIRHLVEAAKVTEIQRKSRPVAQETHQLSFDLEQTQTETEQESKARKPAG
jgi:hypothetical protein